MGRTIIPALEEKKEKERYERWKEGGVKEFMNTVANNTERTADYQFATGQIGFEEHLRELASARTLRRNAESKY